MYLTEQQRKMIEATLFNLVYYDNDLLNKVSFQKYVGSLSDRELEREGNDYMHETRHITKAS